MRSQRNLELREYASAKRVYLLEVAEELGMSVSSLFNLLNKDLIKFAKSSSVVRDMIAEGKKANVIRNYIASNKFRNIANNDDLTNAEIKTIVALLDEVSPKGLFKETDAEIRKMLSEQKKAR